MAEKEYIEREAALESVREKLLITEALPPGIPKDASTFTLASMQHSLESIPAADVRPVVTCGECVHRHDIKRHSCQGRRADFFCADGEKRETDGEEARRIKKQLALNGLGYPYDLPKREES